MNTYSFMVSNSSELSLHIVGGYGILAIPSKLAVQSWQSGYGREYPPTDCRSYIKINTYLVKYTTYDDHYLFLYTRNKE